MPTNKRTPLYAVHKALGARLIPFGGWEMPVEYSGIAKEHTAVRTAAAEKPSLSTMRHPLPPQYVQVDVVLTILSVTSSPNTQFPIDPIFRK